MLGWLTAPLPDGTLQAVALGNFHGAKLSQSPPPKTALRANRITAVTITATNAVNETANCTNVHYWYPARGAVSKHTFLSTTVQILLLTPLVILLLQKSKVLVVRRM